MRKRAVQRALTCLAGALLLVVARGFPLRAAEPVLKELVPPGAQRGKTFTLTMKGELLASGAEVITTLPATLSRLAPPQDLQTPESQLLFLVQLPESAPVGLYPVRVRTESGLSNVLLFSVGDLPEISEKEPNNSIEQAQPLSAPVTVNGNLTAADQDFYRISAKANERLVMEVEARRMASAIDPAIEVLDASGRRVAFNDDAPGLGVDARLDVAFPKAGTYYIVVHDSKYSEQGRNYYRLKVGSYAYADAIFPLGGQRGKSVDVTFIGGNLTKPVKVPVNLDVAPERRMIPVNLPGPRPIGSLPFQFRVTDLPEAVSPGGEAIVDLPPSTYMDGRIEKPGQADRFRLKVSPGQRWVLGLEAASLGTSRLYGGLSVHDPQGKKLPTENLSQGADLKLVFKVPDKVEEVTLAVRDVRGLGGPGFSYRLLAVAETADFSLRLLTPYVNVPANGTALIEVRVERYGYSGPIQLSIPSLPEGLIMDGGNIPSAGLDYVAGRQRPSVGHMTITAKADAKPKAFMLSVWGQAGPAEHPIRRRAEGPGLMFRVNEEPLLNVTGDPTPQKPVTAEWLGMELPAAVTKPQAAVLQTATLNFRLAVGMSHSIPWKLVTPGPGVVPDALDASLDYGEVRGVELRGIRESKGKEGGEVEFGSQPDTPQVKFDVVFLATLLINGKPETVVAPAVTVDLVRGYSLALASDRTELKGGGKIELAGTVQREPSFAAPVKIRVFDPPDKVTCSPIEVPNGKSDFRLLCEAAPDAQGGDFEIHLISSAPIPGRKDNREFSFQPLTTHLIVASGKPGQTVASKQ